MSRKLGCWLISSQAFNPRQTNKLLTMEHAESFRYTTRLQHLHILLRPQRLDACFEGIAEEASSMQVYQEHPKGDCRDGGRWNP